jgi:hypothetical protein
MDNAQLPRPQQTWGQVVFEQESSSVLKRYDEVNRIHRYVPPPMDRDEDSDLC